VRVGGTEHVAASLERAVRLFGAREAVVCGEDRWTYAEFGRRVAAFDAALDDLGLGPGDVVAVLALNSAEHLVAWFSIPRSGRILNDLNTRLAPAELQFIIEDSGAKALLVDENFAVVGRSLSEACESIEHVVYMPSGSARGGWRSMEAMMAGEGRAAQMVEPDAVAGIFYTGGTTGLPKGVMLTHRNLVANAKHAIIGLRYRDEDSYLHAAPMFHLADGAQTYALTWVGGRHVIVAAFEPALWLRTVEAERTARVLLVPTMINMVVNHPQLRDHDLSCVRTMLYGASPMPSELQRAAMEVFDCDWYQAYGMTEAAPIATILTPEDHRRGGARLGSAGRACVGVEVEIARADGSWADAGETGEVWLRGPNIMKGYWNRPAETAAALDGEGWYHSGDAGYLDDEGYLFIVDRVKDMIVSGGENVYSVEVENAIYQHEAVLEAAVFGVPDERWGERVHAAVVLRQGTSASEEEIIAHCRELIAGYKLPRSIDFHSEPLPKSGAGKLLKRDLRAPYWQGLERQVS
jgi:long-chain acyl-CoA synthetase